MDKTHIAVFALLFIAALLPPVSAAEVCDFAPSLPADIYIVPASFNQTPVAIDATVKVENTGSKYLTVYLVKFDGGSCTEEKVLGVAQPGTALRSGLKFDRSYAGQPKASTQYAIVATGDDVPMGKYFSVDEDWGEYERGMHLAVNSFTLFFVPVLSIALIVLLMVLAEWAYGSHSDGDYAKEYTVRTFFFPSLKGRPAGEVVADLLLSPFFWMAEALVLGVMAGIIWNSMADRLGSVAVQVLLLSLAGAIFVPMVYFAIVWYFNEIFEKKPMRFFAAAFFFGMLAALLSLVANTYEITLLRQSGIFDAVMLGFITTVAVAPITEEMLKGLGLLGLFGHHEYDDTLNGILLGFSIGLGFAFIENWFYFASKVNPLEMGLVNWGFLALYRTFFNSVAHGCFSAAVGAALGWAKTQRHGRFAFLAFLPGLALAISLHIIFNITAILDGFAAAGREFPVFMFNPTLVLTLLGLTFVAFVMAVMETRVKAVRGRAYEIMLKGLEEDRKGKAE